MLLTDADVVAEPDAVVALADAFAGEPGLALACGRQSFVADLSDDGTARSAGLGALVDARTAYDRWTARVRRFESKRGALFSVHGQWLAWRAELELAPDPALAADDLDLAFQVRARASAPRAIRLVDAALFHEVRPKRGPAAREQAVRRARAWFQVLAARRPAARLALESARRSSIVTRPPWRRASRSPLADRDDRGRGGSADARTMLLARSSDSPSSRAGLGGAGSA
ncbi:MAG: glycosyltransferase [Planctomycetes bacterium]|nr:glycosyltransferase [Planctomycetota bacterium]